MLERKQKGLLLELPFNMLLGKQRSQHMSVVTVTSCHHGPWHQQNYSCCRLGFASAPKLAAVYKEIISLLHLVLEWVDPSLG